jgi:hypothetical protein
MYSFKLENTHSVRLAKKFCKELPAGRPDESSRPIFVLIFVLASPHAMYHHSAK